MPSTHSATSAFDRRNAQIPDLPWILVGLLAFALFSTSLGAMEVFWRFHGHKPTVRDSPTLWSYHRSRVYNRSGKTIVLIGASRMHADISVPVLERLTPGYRIVQLAAFGHGSPLAVFEDLANDESFAGIVLFDMVPPFISKARTHDQLSFVTSHPTLGRMLETLSSAVLGSMLVSRHNALSLAHLVQAACASGSLPKPAGQQLSFDRNLFIDFHLRHEIVSHRLATYRSEIATYKQHFTEIEKTSFDSDATRINVLVRKLRDRGGKVVFVSLPVTGPYAQFDRDEHLRSHFWNRFTSAVDAVCLHSADFASRLECPDWSHLDGTDARSFTALLHAQLVSHHVFTQER
jgi:hypothetical protein